MRDVTAFGLAPARTISLRHTTAARSRLAPRRPRAHPTAPRMQTWSDPAATREYLEFLAGEDQRPPTTDCASTIVSSPGDPLGGLLASAGAGDDLLLGSDAAVPEDAPGPVYVCAPADALPAILSGIPDAKRADLVLPQDGMLDPLLRRERAESSTRAVLSFSVSHGDAVDPAGGSVIEGAWEGAVRERLAKAGVEAGIASARDFRRASLERLVFVAAFHLVGAVHGGVDLGQVARKHDGEIADLTREMATMLRFSLAVGMMPDIDERLLEYARKVGGESKFEMFEWRNGFFYGHSQVCERNGFPDPTPMHT